MDKDEFCELIRQHEQSMYYLAFSIVKNDADCEDILSESIYRAYKNLRSLKHKKLFKAWILKIIHNVAVEYIRKNANVMLVDDIEEKGVDSSTSDMAMKLTVSEAVKCLKQPYRSVVILYYFENLSILEISHITSKSVVAIKKQLSRARKMLLEKIKEDI